MSTEDDPEDTPPKVRKLPHSFMLGGVTIEVRFSDYMPGEYGCYDEGQLAIFLAAGMPDDLKMEVFWHEVFEAINARFELKLEHPKIQTLATALLQVLRTSEDEVPQ